MRRDDHNCHNGDRAQQMKSCHIPEMTTMLNAQGAVQLQLSITPGTLTCNRIMHLLLSCTCSHNLSTWSSDCTEHFSIKYRCHVITNACHSAAAQSNTKTTGFVDPESLIYPPTGNTHCSTMATYSKTVLEVAHLSDKSNGINKVWAAGFGG